jgi:hypothetical protein
VNVVFSVPSCSLLLFHFLHLSSFFVGYSNGDAYAKTTKPRAATTTETAMLDEPARAAAPLNGATVLVGAETGPEEEAPATPGTGAAGAGPDGGLVAAA